MKNQEVTNLFKCKTCNLNNTGLIHNSKNGDGFKIKLRCGLR